MRRTGRLVIEILTILGLIVAGIGAGGIPARAASPSAPQPLAFIHGEHARPAAQIEAPLEEPDVLVDSGVMRYTMKSPKVFWYTGVPSCPVPLGGGESVQPDQPLQDYHELIRRVATYGSPPRTLYDELRDCGEGQVLSNIISDDEYLYWLDPTGLVKLSTDANPGDPPQLMNALIDAPGEIADGGDRIYALYDAGANYDIYYVRKDNNARVWVNTLANAVDLMAMGSYVYYRVGTTLYRQEPGVDVGVPIASNVTGYYPEGLRLVGCFPGCFFSDRVYIGQSDHVRYYNNLSDSLSDPIYTSVDPSAEVYSLVTDHFNLFFFESRETGCNPFCSNIAVLLRTGRGGGAAEPIYTYDTPTLFLLPNGLATDGSFLFWHDDDQVLRLPNDAEALPQVNMFVTGMEVTQGVQTLNNSVLLIEGRRTFVRLFVKSAGAAVSGVSARLTNTTLSENNQIQPVNPVGTKITVRANPDKDDIDQAFLFELPWSWVQDDELHLQAELNPSKVPLEPTYADNLYSADLSLQPSPDLSVEFFGVGYSVDSTTYTVRLNEDMLATFSWIQRAYPIGGAIGEHFKPRTFFLNGGEFLGTLVDQSSIVCDLLYGGANDDPALCASHIVNGWLFNMRLEALFNLDDFGLKPFAFYYGMISDGAAFPRGQAMYPLTSVGPAGPANGWDTDTTYADWYAGHEIGHSLGRSHPNSGSDDPATAPPMRELCQHSRSDPNYPYGNTSTASAPIGPPDGSLEGFDPGDPSFGIPMAVLPSDTWNDVMSYCDRYWLSDYNYNGMYSYMISNPSAEADSQAISSLMLGDFLAVAGEINPKNGAGVLSLVRRMAELANPPDITPGEYSLRLLDVSGNILVDYPFTPEEIHETGNLSFGQVVDFVAGTRQVQLVRLAGDEVLDSQAVSANPPVISNVSLVGAPVPVMGMVTLDWTASDPDGGPLTFDVTYSRNGGSNFQPVAMGLAESTVQIDTSSLGGSDQALFRVTASDGANSAFAESAVFTMTAKPPQVSILIPEDGLHIHYGQLVNFSGVALDVQDGTVGDAGLAWRDADGNLLETGALLSQDALPVGENVITLTATNSAGESATDSVTIFVDDDLDLPGPTLTAGPSKIGWHLSSGSTEVQAAEVSVNNAGSGDLDWTASSSQPWLVVSPITGTVTAEGDPSLLTVVADPAGLADNESHTAQITLNRPAVGDDPEQVVVIPVSLGIGDTRSGPKLDTSTKVFMPVVIRE